MTVEELLEQYAAGERDFAVINLSEANLSRVSLAGVNLSYSILSIANLSGINLTEANLSYAKLNVARLSGANLVNADLTGAVLNVANLIRANLSNAEMRQAALIRAEMIRADLSGANLLEANISGADLRESKLRQANLHGANLSDADLRGSSAIAANLHRAILNGTDLSKADLSGVDLSNAELRHANLHRTNLSGANLSGANLRWADLSGANLRWADLSDAKLSGANAIGADMNHANLLNTSFVHADLTQANLIRADWEGSDLSGAILTGAKLHGVARYGLHTEGMSCEWVDLSPNGDRSQIYRILPEQFERFFNQKPPTVRIVVDTGLDREANLALARAYHRISEHYTEIGQPPSLEVGHRRTTLTFRVESDDLLFPTVYLAILPFADADVTQKSTIALIKAIQSESGNISAVKDSHRIAKMGVALIKKMRQVSDLKKAKIWSPEETDLNFFKAPTQTILQNSNAQILNIYNNPTFGKRFFKMANSTSSTKDIVADNKKIVLPPASVAIEFLKGCYSLEN
jgi:uncharacterized protein YjbI with pentapeptide repeats